MSKVNEEENLLCHLYKALRCDVPSCGCGDPEAAERLIVDILTEFSAPQPGRSERIAELIGGSDGTKQIVLAAIDHAELIDHGTSIWSSWLTDRGKWVLWAVREAGGIDRLGASLDDVGFPHEWDREAQEMQPCTDECWRVPAEKGLAP